jgi:hypothetical protein
VRTDQLRGVVVAGMDGVQLRDRVSGQVVMGRGICIRSSYVVFRARGTGSESS